MKYILVPYKFGSASAKYLTAADPSFVRASRKKRLDRMYKPGDLIINWGCTDLNYEFPHDAPVLNAPLGVRLACNKLLAFRVLTASGVPVPVFTTDVSVAIAWDKPFIARTSLTGTGGKDAYYYGRGDDVQVELDYRLFSQFIPKTHEYRVHVFDGKVISLQQKRKRNGFNEDPEANPYICNHDMGWVFCRDKVDKPTDTTIEISVDAVHNLGLNFGAVDVVYDKATDKAYVLEVNTAPGLQGSTVHDYVRYIKKTYRINDGHRH